MTRNGNRIDLRLPGLRVVDHRIPARIVLTFLRRRWITLFGPKVDPAGQFARVVSRVNL